MANLKGYFPFREDIHSVKLFVYACSGVTPLEKASATKNFRDALMSAGISKVSTLSMKETKSSP